ncbi:two-component regulator propeller domain-containing protein [Gracilimonas sp.]|uniref:type IX secretion system anionic LPS delivery protein PorZ n=1 Tax=Gracilimonas sp. TaxID=1974203 RepID=UPI0028724930|nr:two-component regulator propeller domain-containing protein [Gracilimonas sp.]
MIKQTILLIVILFSWQSLRSQSIGDWEVYPSFSTVNSISVNNNVAVNGTLGGIFVLEDDRIIEMYTTSDGLYRSDPSSVIFDETSNRIFAGYVDGTIDVINLESGTIEPLEDIKRVDRFSTKDINDFEIYSGSLFVATEFGIVIYGLQNLLVDNSYLKLGSFDIGTPVNDIEIESDSVYAATQQGIAIGDLSANLVENNNWDNFDSQSGMSSDIISKVAVFKGTVYALTEGNEINIRNNGAWEISNEFPNEDYVTLTVNKESNFLTASTNSTIYILDEESSLEIKNLDLNSDIIHLAADGDELYLGTRNNGLGILNIENDSPQFHLPPGPYLNFFNDLLADNGAVAATSTPEFPSSDPFNPIRGYYMYNGEQWLNFNRDTREELHNVSTVFTLGHNDSHYYFGSWGSGVIRHEKATNEIQVFNRTNSTLTGIEANPNYVVISGLHSDSQQNMWATSFNADFPLYVQLNGTDEWIPFENLSGNDNYFNLFVDSFDQKWISLISENNNGLGLLVIDTGNPENENDDNYVKLGSSISNGNLPNETITAIIQDKNEEVWVGTERGIASFIFPELVINGGPNERQAQWLINEDTSATSRYLLRDVNVSAIAVNDANQKWIGSSNQGLWLLNEEGSRIEKRFTTENSNLISNTINSISIDGETGQVFIATDLGLTSYQDVPKAPVSEMDKLKVFPNPFQYSKNDQIFIEDLGSATQIKILGVDGFVVNELEGTGGRISWDGYDYNGNRLGTGVYFVVAYQADGSQRGIGKVVIAK